jgi:ADP-dependent NAD(P)H-hydrate dehydratase
MTDGPRVVTLDTLREWALPAPGSDKDARGRLLVVGGSTSSPGAVRLAAEAALRAGAGKVRVATVDAATGLLGLLLPEVGTVPLATTSGGQVDPSCAADLVTETGRSDAVLVGPGLTGTDEAVGLVSPLVAGIDVPVVIDGLASAFLTTHPDGARHRDGSVVLTVNTTELARTDGCSEENAEDEGLHRVAARVAERSRVVVLHGGTEKHVATPDGDAWVVRGGGPGLAVSGSGDVQAGLVAGLLARGAEPAQAAVWGAFLHAQAGERLSGRVGHVGFLASELAGEVPPVLDLAR